MDEKHPRNNESPFLQWLANYRGNNKVFWLSGKAGSGKSTLMKFLHTHPTFRKLHKNWMVLMKLSKVVVAGFYFYDRGDTTLQNSREGLLRALIYDLLRQAPSLKEVVLERKATLSNFQHNSEQAKRFGYSWSWTDLKEAFMKFMQHKPDDLGVYVFADGLDEYSISEAFKQSTSDDNEDGDDDDGGENSIYFSFSKTKGHRDIAEFSLQLSNYLNIKICLSSRPLPVFENRFDSLPYLKLEDLTRQDIANYVRSILDRANRNNVLTTCELSNIINMTVNAASGVFPW